MKILVIIPPFTTIPASGHGGTERIAEGMINELLRRGHDITLWGAGQCKTKAHYVALFDKTITELKKTYDDAYIEQSRPLRVETAYLAKVSKHLLDHSGEFDVVFNHMRGGFLLLPLQKMLKVPVISTLHLPLFEQLVDVLSEYKITNMITISNSQRKPAGNRVNFLATVYNGLDIHEFSYNEKPDDYFFFMGAMGEHKSPHLAIEACKKAGVKLVLAGGKAREPYFSKKVKPLIDGERVQFVGEVKGEQRIDLLKNAKGFLMPITWEEPFGLAMIEAMACGTPVIGFNHGAVAEVVQDGQTGFVVENVSAMAKAIKKIDTIDRQNCRKTVEDKFTYEKMVDGYLEVAKKAGK